MENVLEIHTPEHAFGGVDTNAVEAPAQVIELCQTSMNVQPDGKLSVEGQLTELAVIPFKLAHAEAVQVVGCVTYQSVSALEQVKSWE